MSNYHELKAQAEALMRQAEELRKVEVSAVIAEIKQKMREFQLTPADLGFLKVPSNSKSPRASSTLYRNAEGKTWGGRGPRPQWLRDALAEGKTLEEFKV